jgi:hypothetical protein
MQTRLMSMVETITNVAIGLVVSFLSQVVIFKYYDIHISLAQNLEMTLYFTVVSILRGFFLRRLFNRMSVSLSK